MVADKTEPTRTRSVIVRIMRQDTPATRGRWEDFRVPVEPGDNIISCLQSINTNPSTTSGQESTPVAFDAGCLEEVCGSCTMLVNGRVRQACSALIDDLAPRDGDIITLEPMGKFPIVRDLIVDRSRLFHSLKRVKAWVPIDGTYDLGPGPLATPENQQTRYKLSECMSCGCCLEACPQFNLEPAPADWDKAFIGAHAISQARLFNEHDTGRVEKAARLDTLMGPGGVGDCGNAQNCVKVCPKEIPLTESIAAIGRAVSVHAVKKFFAGK